MPDSPRSGRKDRDPVADVADELKESINQDRHVPKYENPNRDRARGDRDRSRKHVTQPPGEDVT
jgi:hypothetical protein